MQAALEQVKKRLMEGSPLAVRAWGLANNVKNIEQLIDLAAEQLKKEYTSL